MRAKLGLTERISHRCSIGDAVTVIATKLLADGISSSYPCTNDRLDPSGRFCVLPAENNREEYVISDLDLEMDTHLPKAWLEEPAFDLVSWYRQHLDQHEYFEQQYYKAHRDMYFQIPGKDDLRGK